jgi:hypothetical protein
MPPIAKLIATVLFVASLFTVTINLSAANNSSTNSNKTQSSQASNLSETKKILKKKLSLDYTNPKFETDLSKDQKDSILTALKKWKGELPVDNTFTVTSIASLKTKTTDTKSKVKKSKKETPNAQVVYMWARSTNPNWPIDRIPAGEESEEGDPRFIRTEFNVLLKQTKNGKYKASIERDAEVKTESLEVSESALDDKILQDLFGTNIADNALTATTDVLIEPNSSSISVVSNVSNSNSFAISSLVSISSVTNSQANVSNSSQAISTISPTNSTSSNNSLSSKTVGFLESILNFGSVKASAGEFDYSWPWRNGEVWQSGKSWHQCETIYNNFPTYGCSLDFNPLYTNASNDILAPITGTIQKACDDGVQGYMQIGDNMTILHMASSTLVYNSIPGVYVTKSTKIGTMYPNAIPENTIINQCGSSNGKHIHIKLKPITETFPGSKIYQGSMPAIDGVTINGGTNYRTLKYTDGSYSPVYTSQNTPPPSVLPVFNNQPGTIQLKGYPGENWSFDVQNYGTVNNGTYNQSRVQMWRRNSDTVNNAQKWQYNTSTKQIIGMNDYCLDAGNGYDGDYLRINQCNNGSNQKWIFNTNNSISTDISNRCIQYETVTGGRSWNLAMRNCTGNGDQKWETTGINLPVISNITDPNINTVLPPQAAWYLAMDFRCGTNNDTAVVIRSRDNGSNCQKMRYNSNNTITNAYGKCLDAGDVNSSSNNWLRFSACYNVDNQKWKQEPQSNGGRIWSLKKNNSNQSMCIEYSSLNDQASINTNVCNANQGQKWYPDVQITQEYIPTPPVPTSNYKLIKSYTNGSYGFNIYGGGNANETPIKMFTLSGTDNELWFYDTSTNQIKSKLGKCIDAWDTTNVNNRWIRINDCNNGTNQKFTIDGSARIHSVTNSGLCIDSANGNNSGSTLFMFPCHFGTNQQWQIY